MNGAGYSEPLLLWMLAVMPVVRDALDETGKNFLRLILGRVFHGLNSRDAGLSVAT